ncbi:MAG TPA: hypothetical protein VG076_07950 [Acidimicrobiales bacterium]|nr:hypothetical protein [Acidimicrobiales bacterium]
MITRHLHDANRDVAVLCCTEAGRLERQSVLLCETIRRRGGRFADLPVYSFQPRPGPALAAKTRERFAELGVVHIEAPLNVCLPSYGFGNKAHAAAFAEAFLDHDIFVVMDSDMLVLSEPREFDLPDGVDLALRPEPFKVAGTTDDDENAEMWDAFERHAGVNGPRRYVETTVSRERIRAYYNSGLIVARRSLGLMRRWHDLTESLANSGVIPQDSRAIFTEQYGLAMAIATLGVEPDILPPTYNYGLPWHDQLPDDVRAARLGDVVVAHYFHMFDLPGRANALTRVPGLRLTADDAEIAELIRATGVTPDPMSAPIRSARLLGRERAVQLAKRLGVRRRYGAMLENDDQ